MKKLLLKDFITASAITNRVIEESLELAKSDKKLFERIHTPSDDTQYAQELYKALAAIQIAMERKDKEAFDNMMRRLNAIKGYFTERNVKDLVTLIDTNLAAISNAEITNGTFEARFSNDPNVNKTLKVKFMPTATGFNNRTFWGR